MEQSNFEKEKEEAIKTIVELLNKYNLTITVEHSIKILQNPGGGHDKKN
jgi:hypothetical protein